MSVIGKEMQFFFGENPKKFDAVMINLVSFGLGIVLAFFVPFIRENTTLLQKIVIVLIAWDDLGGVVANLTKSTNDFHAKSRKTRLFFYSLHFLQPLALALAFKTSLAFFLFCWLYPVISSFFVTDVIKENKNTIAGLLWIVGIILYIYAINPPPVLLWFGVTFFTKIIISYSINHFPNQS
jgi:hypothetical protein